MLDHPNQAPSAVSSTPIWRIQHELPNAPFRAIPLPTRNRAHEPIANVLSSKLMAQINDAGVIVSVGQLETTTANVHLAQYRAATIEWQLGEFDGWYFRGYSMPPFDSVLQCSTRERDRDVDAAGISCHTATKVSWPRDMSTMKYHTGIFLYVDELSGCVYLLAPGNIHGEWNIVCYDLC